MEGEYLEKFCPFPLNEGKTFEETYLFSITTTHNLDLDMRYVSAEIGEV